MVKDYTIKHKLDTSVLPYVLKPGRYVGNEINVIHKDLSQIDIRFALAFPEVYEIAMSSQATVILYHLLNQIDYVWAERVFAPWIDMELRMRDHDLPLYALESFSPLRDFDVLGFTLQYELTYANILNMLDLAGIPMWSHDRNENHPLIIAGGPCTCNPEPMADFFDAIFIGDAEQGITELCSVLRIAKRKSLTRADTLNQLEKLRGIYIPSFYQVQYDRQGRFEKINPMQPDVEKSIKSCIIPVLSRDAYPVKPIVPLIETTHNRLAVEIMRGCTEGCRFCNAGMIYRPTRERDEDDILAYSKDALEHTGYEEVSFLSLSASDYERLPSLMNKELEALAGKHINFSFPSLRLDTFNTQIAEFASTVRKSGFTFAPEAGSTRLRCVINKNINDDDLMNAVAIALQYGWKKLKFYFMIGLPTETKEDVLAIVELLKRVVRLGKGYGKIQLNVSLSSFSPKSHTPFQWEKKITKEEIWEKINLLRSELKLVKQIKLSWQDAALSEIETILGRGDRRLGPVIYSAWKNGAKFDGWNEMFNQDNWLQAFNDNKIDRTDYLAEIPETQPLAWNHIDKGVSINFLKRERRRAYQEMITIDCREGTCFGCGIQRKGGFREYADCYKQLHLHNKGKTLRPYPLRKEIQNNTIDKNQDPESDHTSLVRLHYQKMGYARYLSHLDIVRTFERALRRAQVKLSYSQGFNPHPKMSFGPALPLGYTSEAEFLDMEIYTNDSRDLKDELNSVLPDGIKVKKTIKIPISTPSLSSSINLQEYRIEISGKPIAAKVIGNMLQENKIIIIRDIKGQKKSLDIRPFIESISQENGSLKLFTRIIEGRSVRISEILRFLYDDSKTDYNSLPIHRRNQYIRSQQRQISPMDII